MIFKFEYLGEYGFTFKNNLGSESGNQGGSFDIKKTRVGNLVHLYLYSLIT
jgi:hypothetical protein